MADQRDEKLLQLLEANARTPVAELARAVNLSPTAVRQRLARMERDGTILGYSVRRGAQAPSSRVQALVTLTLGHGTCRDLLNSIGPLPEVETYWTLAGESDAVMLVRFADMDGLQAFSSRLQAHEAVARVTTKVILETLMVRER